MSIKHIIFDWNGTLLDDLYALHGCTNKLLESAGHPPVTQDFFQNHYDIPFRQLYHNLGLDQAQIDRLVNANNSVFHEHYEAMAATAALRAGALDVLQHAKADGIGTHILSNHLVEPIQQQLRRLDIENLFHSVIAYPDRAAQQNRHMTKGDKLRDMRKEKGIACDTTMIIGDSIEEIEIGHEQGLISVGITGGCVTEQRLRAAKPHYLIHSLAELKPILIERKVAA